MEGGSVTVEVDALRGFAARVLTEAGMTEDEADIVADVLVWADVRGVESHGVMRLPTYAEQVRGGAIRSPAPLRIKRITPCLGLVEAGGGAGHVVACATMDAALAMAREVGAGIVVARRSNHIGAAGYYAARAAAAGCIGVVLTNADPTMVPFGGQRPFFGTNPLAVAMPSSQAHPVVLDMATSAAAMGKILLAARSGEPIPEGWAVDAEGRPTRDAAAALDGGVVPAAGHKGSGLAFAIEALTGILAAAAHAPQVPPPTPSRPQELSHLMVAIDVNRFSSTGTFQSLLDEMINDLHEVPPAQGCQRVLFPGELEGIVETTRRQTGIPLRTEVREALEALGPAPWKCSPR